MELCRTSLFSGVTLIRKIAHSRSFKGYFMVFSRFLFVHQLVCFWGEVQERERLLRPWGYGACVITPRADTLGLTSLFNISSYMRKIIWRIWQFWRQIIYRDAWELGLLFGAFCAKCAKFLLCIIINKIDSSGMDLHLFLIVKNF